MAEDGTAAFFEQLLESMGIKPEKAKQYAESLVAEEYDLRLMRELSAHELKTDFGFVKGDIKRFEGWKQEEGGGASPRQSANPSEDMTSGTP